MQVEPPPPPPPPPPKKGGGPPGRAACSAFDRGLRRPTETVNAVSQIDAGRYLVKIGGCNDCHTPGYVEQLMMTGKAMPEADWLMGSDVGFAGAGA